MSVTSSGQINLNSNESAVNLISAQYRSNARKLGKATVPESFDSISLTANILNAVRLPKDDEG